MFKEYESVSLTYDHDLKQYRWEYKIIDDDFEEEIGSMTTISVEIGNMYAIRIAIAVIDTYNKRNLPVAPNLIRAMLWHRDSFNASLDDQVVWNKKYNPRWSEIEQDMKKYLLFS